MHHNHRRTQKKDKSLREADLGYRTSNGYNPRDGKRNDSHLDKSMQGWGRLSRFADVAVGAGIGNDFSKGNRGMAKAVRGAKKFVNSRVRRAERDALNGRIRCGDVDD